MTDESVYEHLRREGVSRRDFLKLCGVLAGSLAVFKGPLGAVDKAFADEETSAAVIADVLKATAWTPVIWMGYQGCTGCTESFARGLQNSAAKTLLNALWLDYHDTLMAAAGTQAEAQRTQTIQQYPGKYLMVVDGSVPMKNGGQHCVVGGHAAMDVLRETAASAKAVVAIGNCAAFGGLPAARPNPTGATSVSLVIGSSKLVNVPGCPPIPDVLNGTLAYFLVNGAAPPLDARRRPRAFFGSTIHDGCPRQDNYDEGRFAKSFDDAGAKRGYCLFELGCKGPVTNNACATTGWMNGLSFPIDSGHPCIGCADPSFWDRYHVYQRGPKPSD